MIRIVLFLFILLAVSGEARAEEIPFFAKYPHIDRSIWYSLNDSVNGDWQGCEWRRGAVTAKDGNVLLTLSNRGGRLRRIGCGELHTRKRLGYGRYEARMRTAAGSGLNTAFFTYVGPPNGQPEHDEIDFEFLGKTPRSVELNYWSNGRQQPSTDVDLGFDASADFHDYAFEWTPGKIRWFADGKLLHESPEGADVPDKPGYLFFSLWSGSHLEDAWLGPFTYTAPVTAEVAWTRFTPF